MPLTVPDQHKRQAELPHQSEPWYWLWELVLDEPAAPAAPTITRLVANPTDVVWPTGSAQTWYSFGIRQGDIEQSSEGKLPGLDLTLDNTQRFLMPYLEEIDGMEGRRATAYLVNRKTLSSAPLAFVEWRFEVASASAKKGGVGLRLEMPNLFQRRYPSERYNAARCRWLEFGGPECGYVINSSAAYTRCNRTLSDCGLRGADELARGLPVLHPLLFGGQPGVSIQRAS